MKLTCGQMDILVSFYMENELSPCLKQQVEDHLKGCSYCSAKFKMVKTIFSNMKTEAGLNCFTNTGKTFETNDCHNIFKTNLSAYIDNELSNEENIRMKKYTITNKTARKALEDSYNIRRLMKESFKKSKSDAKKDYSKKIIKQLELEDRAQMEFHPAINLLILFTITVLVITAIVLIALNS